MNPLSRCLLLSALAVTTPSVQAAFNGDFSDGLNSWTFAGDVAAISGEAVLADNLASHSYLFQGVPMPPASFIIQFDFFNNLSASFNPGTTFPDAFFATVYYINNLGQFDPLNNGFDASTALFDMDANGVYNVHPDAVIGASPLGVGWQRVTALLPNAYNFVIPMFELFSLNLVAGDSSVRLDNVLVAIPEPRLLFAAGLAALAAGTHLRRRKR
jgi:hypothetical protein